MLCGTPCSRDKLKTQYLKAPIHDATLLPATVFCNDVAWYVVQCCVVACCWQLLLTFRPPFYSRATVAEKIKRTDTYMMSESTSAHSVFHSPRVVCVLYVYEDGQAREACYMFSCAMATEHEEEFRWMDEKVNEFVVLLEERPCLFCTKLKDYHNLDKRKTALEEVTTALGATGEMFNNPHFYIAALIMVVVSMNRQNSGPLFPGVCCKRYVKAISHVVLITAG